MPVDIPPTIVAKIKQFCAYQERSHQEVKEKLYGMGLYKSQVEPLLSILIEENYLNEERFATQFAGGRFRIKNWGKTKIKYELQLKKVSTANIKLALSQINEDDYLATAQKLAAKKWALLQKEPVHQRIYKTQQYLLQKGFENAIAKQAADKAAGNTTS